PGDYRLKPVEAWSGHHDLVAPAGQRLDGGTKDLAGARAQDNAIELHAANARDLTPQQLGFRFRIPVHQACRPFYRCDDLRRRSVRVFVAVEPDGSVPVRT